MVGLSKNRKGMVAIVDALIFISVLSIAAVVLFSYTGNADDETPMAESVSNDLFSMKLSSCDLYDTSDTSVYPIAVLIAVNMEKDDVSSLETFLKDTMDDLIPSYCGYSLSIGYHGKVLYIERQGEGEMDSSYSSEIMVTDSDILTYRVTVS